MAMLDVPTWQQCGQNGLEGVHFSLSPSTKGRSGQYLGLEKGVHLKWLDLYHSVHLWLPIGDHEQEMQNYGRKLKHCRL